MAMNVQTSSELAKKELRGNGRARPNLVEGCPITAAVAAIGGKWKMIIIYRLGERPRHFAGLRRLLPGISQKVLAEQLRELIDDGLVLRRETGPIPAPVRYELTEYGETALPLVRAVDRWGETHLSRREDCQEGSA